ncbi:VOC family protein [Leptospira jelokensis]|uniref:VOC family protein n=1 Tax=Leptospira jelokensis TaxID=2484931 RepID=A0A4Z0ZXY1_9LEPT|nr:VOC family protein [Leptospira jelokensis]TGL62595.1 VOC family protein [Leptospira jelokensis]TGM06465.1 VOC family protein [Leptospira jelokensis]
MIHHIAIGTPHPAELAKFYRGLPGAVFVKEFHYESGELRSVWIQFDSILLMVEEGKKEAPKNLVFSLTPINHLEWKDWLRSIPITHHTDFTIYFQDPDGNGLGISSYPEKLTIPIEMS